MYIGNYAVGQRFEMSIDPESPHYVMPSALETRYGIAGQHFNDNYVSWWPGGGADLVNPKAGAEPMNGLYKDVDAEDSEPHVVYNVYGLDVAAMRRVWHQARDKQGAHYQLYRKNCSDLVMRVLKAGGALSRIGRISGAYFGHNLLTTPKDVAVVCNKLRDAGWATKQKAGNCPSKRGNKLMVVLGMR
ncbi:hypothetical protein [Limobrevibacterium gyesilva]|nr:hypothetical protein [Limobrevibacterium gyesilva]